MGWNTGQYRVGGKVIKNKHMKHIFLSSSQIGLVICSLTLATSHFSDFKLAENLRFLTNGDLFWCKNCSRQLALFGQFQTQRCITAKLLKHILSLLMIEPQKTIQNLWSSFTFPKQEKNHCTYCRCTYDQYSNWVGGMVMKDKYT